jgi:heptosyltransferase I
MITDEGARDVCLILLTGIGDVVHGLPVANALKDDDLERRITWVAEPAPAAVLRHHPSVDDVIEFHRKDGLAGVMDLWRSFRGRRFDLALNMQRHSKALFPTILSGAPVRVGLDRDKVREGVWRFSTHHIEPAPWVHTQDLLLRFLDRLGVSRPEPLEWRITFSAGEREAQRAFFEALPDGPVVGLALGSGAAAKDWEPERYVSVADRLADEFGATVLLVGGPGSREQGAAALVMDRTRCLPVATLGDDVRRLMWTVDGCDLLISPDSGPLHIAHALDVPVIGLYGFTNPACVGPYHRFHDLLIDRYHDPGEAPDAANTAKRGGRMSRITPDDVLERVRIAFERYIGARRVTT